MPSTEVVPISEYRALANFNDAAELIRNELQGQQVSEFNLSRVKIPAGGGTTWEVPGLGGATTPAQKLEGVVVLSKFSRSYWDSKYSGGNEPPDCSSPDAQHAQSREGFDVPAPADPANPSGYLCNGCAFAEWQSAVRDDGSQGRGQACKMTRVLFLLTAERMLPLIVVLPPTSLKPAQSYFLSLADYGIDHRAIRTTVSLVKRSAQGVPDHSVAVFEAGEQVEPAEATKIREYSDLMRDAFARIRVDDRAAAAPNAADTA